MIQRIPGPFCQLSNLEHFLALAVVGLIANPGASQHEQGQQHELRHHTADHGFEDAERWSAMFDSEERDTWQKPAEVMTLMGLAEGMTVADIGAGTGYFVAHLTHAVGPTGKVLALDVEPAMVEFMEQRGERQGWHNVAARVVDADDPGLDPSSVDRILIVNTWHHISNREAYAAQLRASLAEGGALYIVDLTLESENGPPVEQRLAPERVIAELEAGGFDAELLDETLPEQYIVIGRPRAK